MPHIQYIPRNMHTVTALLCFVVVIHWLIFPYPSGLLHWHCGNLTIAPVPAKQPWWIWINTPCEFIMNDCITTTKQSTTKPCAYFLGYTVCLSGLGQHCFGYWLGADQALPESLLIFLSIEPVGTNFNEIRIKTQNLSIFCSRVGGFFRWGYVSASTLERNQRWSCIMGKLHPREKQNSEGWYPSIPMSIDDKIWLNHKGCVLFILR